MHAHTHTHTHTHTTHFTQLSLNNFFSYFERSKYCLKKQTVNTEQNLVVAITSLKILMIALTSFIQSVCTEMR
jgi:hypothetical protein